MLPKELLDYLVPIPPNENVKIISCFLISKTKWYKMKMEEPKRAAIVIETAVMNS